MSSYSIALSTIDEDKVFAKATTIPGPEIAIEYELRGGIDTAKLI